MIKTVLLDLDDTIFDFHKAEKIALIKALKQLNISTDEKILERYSQINAEQWKLLEQGKLNRQEVKVCRYKLLFDEIGVDKSPRKATKIYEQNLAVGHYFIDRAEEMLKKLYKKYSLYIASNGAVKIQKGRIESSGIEKYVKDIFISEAIGFNKPNIEFFNYCFSKIPDFKKDETVIIGDSITSDIQGGKNAGIKTVWFNPKGIKNDSDIIPDYEIKGFGEICSLISKI
ncbi:MAG: YjjG family noncanonical pyrimidine nucleotidase [Ruminococcus sp.]|nr:YjjG family noncanonical pyrimidine nucleotidase [Ruminococcus sp.]